MHDLVGTLTAAAPALPPVLGGAQAQARLWAAAAQLPAALTDWIYVECRLLGPADRLDLIVRVERRGRDLLARMPLLCAGSPTRADEHAWSRIAGFARRWTEGDERMQALAGLWLEFDLKADARQPSPALPAPRLFFDYSGAHLRMAHPVGELAPCIWRPLRALFGSRPPRALVRGLDDCLRLLPASAFIPSIGVPTASSWDGLRLCVGGLRREDLLRLLGALRWPGSVRALSRLHRRIAMARARPDDGVDLLHLDLSPAVSPRIGIEYVPCRERAPARRRDHEARLLSALVSEGLCDSARREALLGWSGQTLSTLAHELWPSLAVRGINNLKIVFDGEAVVDRKAYPSVAHAFHALHR